MIKTIEVSDSFEIKNSKDFGEFETQNIENLLRQVEHELSSLIFKPVPRALFVLQLPRNHTTQFLISEVSHKWYGMERHLQICLEVQVAQPYGIIFIDEQASQCSSVIQYLF